ncbi:MAG TPA: hypothetical protein VFD38_02150 [Myxococcaceae bacterium]|nr:hypothetical protein [Myxococcaceae bacterium]
MLRAALTSLVLVLAGCATANANAPPPSAVLLEAPQERCEPLGVLAVRMSTELLTSEDALHASALNELRRRAGVRGATHLVVARTSSPGSMTYVSTAAASGLAYRCPSPG